MSEFEGSAAQPPTFQDLLQKSLDFLEQAEPTLLAVLPELSASAAMKNDAARERSHAALHRAEASYARLMGAGKQEKATHELAGGLSKAAVRLLDAQAEAYLPLTGDLFCYQTLEILALMSIKFVIDFAGPGRECYVTKAVEVGCMEWRARWKDQEAAKLSALEAEKRPPTTSGSDVFDFSTTAAKAAALAAYRVRWPGASDAAIARSANVDPADMSKWKKNQLPLTSAKGTQIERVLRNKEAPGELQTRSAQADG